MSEPAGGSGIPLDALPRVLLRAVAASAQSITIADAAAPDAPLVYVNRAFAELTGYPPAEALGRNCRFLQGPDTDPDAVAVLREAVVTGRDALAVVRNYRRDGTWFWNEIAISPVPDDTGRITHFIGYQMDVTDRVERERALADLAFRDRLTGLSTREYLIERLSAMLTGADHDASVAVLYVDLDEFHRINEMYDPQLGNLVLQGVAHRLATLAGPEDVLARLEADTFVLARRVRTENVTAETEHLAEQISSSLRPPIPTPAVPITVRVHCGAAWTDGPAPGATPLTLLHAARRDLQQRRARHERARPRPDAPVRRIATPG